MNCSHEKTIGHWFRRADGGADLLHVHCLDCGEKWTADQWRAGELAGYLVQLGDA